MVCLFVLIYPIFFAASAFGKFNCKYFAKMLPSLSAHQTRTNSTYKRGGFLHGVSATQVGEVVWPVPLVSSCLFPTAKLVNLFICINWFYVFCIALWKL